MPDQTFFDACSIQSAATALLPAGACGALIYDAPDAGARVTGERGAGELLFAETLRYVVGANDPRFPPHADVLHLRFDFDTLLSHLKEPPAHWWPLCGAVRENDVRPIVLHIDAREFNSLARGVTRLARAFPNIRILIEPFASGKASNWQAGVCLAEEPNIWVTTRGLFAAARAWPERSEREALYFTIGEVGAGKLLFASGLSPAELNAQTVGPAAWLEGIHFLGVAQCDLILRQNVVEALMTKPL